MSPDGDVMSQILVISEQPEETPGVEVPEFSSPNGDVLSYAILYNWQFLFSSPDGDAMFRPKVAKQYLLPTPYPHYNKKILPMQGNPFDRTENSGAKGRGVGLAKARLGNAGKQALHGSCISKRAKTRSLPSGFLMTCLGKKVLPAIVFHPKHTLYWNHRNLSNPAPERGGALEESVLPPFCPLCLEYLAAAWLTTS